MEPPHGGFSVYRRQNIDYNRIRRRNLCLKVIVVYVVIVICIL